MSRRNDIHAVPLSPTEARDLYSGQPNEAPPLEREQLTDASLDAARRLAQVHHEIAAELPPDSPIRALTLRCGNQWARLGRLPRRGLRQMPSDR